MSNLEIKVFTLGELATNCYLVWDKSTNQAIVIDPADSGETISAEIIKENLTLEKIILTHGHFDHVLGLLEVKLNFPTAPIYLHRDDLFLLQNAQKSALHWLDRQVDPVPPPDSFYQDGDQITVGQTSFQIIHTPGHTPGSISLYSKQEKLLFSGDTLFKRSIGRTDFKYSNHQKILESLKQLANLAKDTRVLSGHGQETTIGDEYNWLEKIT